MVRESWELWADDYQERDEGKFDYDEEYTKDDISQWKEEEQKMIDDLCKRMEKAYNDNR